MTISRNLSELARKLNIAGTVLTPGGGTGIVSAGTSGQMLTSDGTAWTSNYGIILSNLTLYVATTGNDTTGDGLTSGTAWATPHKAMAWLRDRTIGSGVVVTVSVADGAYTFTQTLNLNHPQGDQIFINGGTTTGTRPTGAALNGGGVRGNTAGTLAFNDALLLAYYNTQWQFNGCTGLECIIGGGVTINTVLIRGNATTGTSGVQCGYSTGGVTKANAGSINLGTTVAVHNFGGTGIRAIHGGSINASNVTVTNSGTGIIVSFAGSIQATSATSSNNTFSGIQVSYSGGIVAVGAISSNNGLSGILTSYGGSIFAINAIATNNNVAGFYASLGGIINVLLGTATGNAGTADIYATGCGYIGYRAGTAGSFSPALGTVGNGNALIEVV
jgi:hypothetical protein